MTRRTHDPDQAPSTPPTKRGRWTDSSGEELVAIIDTSIGTPETKAKFCKAREDEELPYYSPTSIEETIGNGIKTKTPRKTMLRPIRKFSLTRGGSDTGEESQISGIFAAKVHENPPESKPDLSSLEPEPKIIKRKIESVHITTEDIRKSIGKRRDQSQNQVMKGKSAKEEIEEFLGKLDKKASESMQEIIPPKPYHWCHILGFCLVSGVYNPQNKANLVAGASIFNYSQKHYEIILRDLLSSNTFSEMDIAGEALLYEGTQIAKSITLNVTLYKNNEGSGSQPLTTSLTFDANAPQKESSLNAKIFEKILTIIPTVPSVKTGLSALR